jgi:hypothetical protein
VWVSSCNAGIVVGILLCFFGVEKAINAVVSMQNTNSTDNFRLDKSVLSYFNQDSSRPI